jgi:bacillolysin
MGWQRRLVLASLAVASASACAVGCSSSSPAPLDPQSQLEHDTGVPWIVVRDARYGTPTYLEPTKYGAPVLAPGAAPDVAAMAFLVKYAALFQLKDPANELTLEDVEGPDGLGITHATFTQKEGAASVYGTRMGVHFDALGRIAFISGIVVPNLYGFSTAPSIDAPTAIANAQADIVTRFSAGELLSPDPTDAPELIIDTFGAAPALAYHLSLSYTYSSTDASDADEPAALHVGMGYVVDATTGAILEAVSPNRDGEVTASGHGVQFYERGAAMDTKQFQATTDPSQVAKYRMVIPSTGSRSKRVAYQPTALAAPPNNLRIVRSSNLNDWDSTKPIPGSAVDAYTYLGVVDDWWRTRYQRSSYDGKSSPIIVIDRDPGMTNNAYWSDSKNGGDNRIHVCLTAQVTLPVGDFSTFCGSAASTSSVTVTPISMSAALDIMGHEFQHAVTSRTLNLGFYGQAGALDESLSDIFGNFIERSSPQPGSDPLQQGEIVGEPFTRSLAFPQTSGWPQPDYLNGAHYVPDSNTGCDAGGRHFNDGVPNNAWYLTTFGGTNQSSNVTVTGGIGYDNVEKLYVSTVTGRAIAAGQNRQATGTQIQSFNAFGHALVGTAKNLPGATNPDGSILQGGPANTVACAWFAVGVFTKDDLKKENVKCDFNPCSGKADGTYCGRDLQAPNPTDTYECASGFAFDFGPNGGGCGGTGSDAGPSNVDAGAADVDAGPPNPPPDAADFDAIPNLCSGHADGTYCGRQLGAPNSADEYKCINGYLFDFGQCFAPTTCVDGAGCQ